MAPSPLRIVILAKPRLKEFQHRAVSALSEEPGVDVVAVCVDRRRRNLREGGPHKVAAVARILRRRGLFSLVLAWRYLRYGRRGRDPYTGEPTSSTTALCRSLSIPYHDVPDLYAGEVVEMLRDFGADLAVLFGFGIIREPILSLFPRGILGMHHGDMRRYRGTPPVFWEMYHGEREVGVTVQQISAELDRGRVVEFQTKPIDYSQSLRRNRQRIYEGSEILLLRAVRRFRDPAYEPAPLERYGTVYTRPQLHEYLKVRVGRVGRTASDSEKIRFNG